MGLGADLQANVNQFIKTNWTRTEGRVVPEPKDIGLGNDGVDFKNATCLYADLADSTVLVSTFSDWFAAMVYKSFLHCATKIIRDEGGSVTSFDGDRVMGIFLGDNRLNTAARVALKINWATSQMVEPAIKANWSDHSVQSLRILHTVGIDDSKVFAARTGTRGDNDIVWVGRAPNFAAKLAAWRDPRMPTLITADVFAGLSGPSRDSNGTCMWKREPRDINGVMVYSSAYYQQMN